MSSKKLHGFDAHLLIAEIHKREALWKRKHPYHHHRRVLDKLWNEVAEVVGTTAHGARKKWKNLKDHFRTELRRVQEQGTARDEPERNYQSFWVYYDKLAFLESEIPPRALPDAPVPHEAEPEEENSEESGLIDTDSITKQIPNMSSISSIGQPDLHPDDIDNYYFFMSLLPHVRHFDSIRTLTIRNKIQQLIIEEAKDHIEYSALSNQNTIQLVDVKPFKNIG